MYHFHTKNDNSGEHFGVSHNTQGRVLVQLGDATGEQVRIIITSENARFMARRLIEMADISDEELKNRHILYVEENETKKYIKSINPIVFTTDIKEAKILLNWNEIHENIAQYKEQFPEQPLPDIDTFKEWEQLTTN